MGRKIDLLTYPYRDTPVTSIVSTMMCLYTVGLGLILNLSTSHFAPAQLKLYQGPMTIGSLTTWSWAYMLCTIAGLLSLYLRGIIRGVMYYLHMVVPIAWATAFDLGPVSTGQANYTLIAVLVCFVPFMVVIIQRRYGFARPPIPVYRNPPVEDVELPLEDINAKGNDDDELQGKR